MVMQHRRRGGGRRRVGLVTGFLLGVLSGPGHGLEGPEPPAGNGCPAMRLYLTVRQGRPSVDLREAEVGEVLARLAHEAGTAILSGSHAGTRISAQFTDVELERGLHYLIPLASLSCAIRYAQGPAGAVVIQEVRVFRAAPRGPPPAGVNAPVVGIVPEIENPS
jgi:hypothetical protein